MREERNGQKPLKQAVRCPLCGEGARHKFSLRHTLVWRCASPACRLEFAWPQLGEYELAHAYQRFYYPREGEKGASFENTPDMVLRQVFASLQNSFGSLAGLRLLDYGCGVGALLRVAREFGMEPTGIEPDAEARRSATKSARTEVFANTDALLRAHGEAEFHFVVLWTVIEHLRRPWEDLARLRELLTPNGKLFLSTINTRCLRARVERKSWGQYQNPTHFYFFDRRSLGRVIWKAGFTNALELPVKLRFAHHSVPRRWLYHATFALGLADGLFFLCQGERSAAQIKTKGDAHRVLLGDLREDIGSVA